MLYLLDTANLEDIKKGVEYYPITGITTNPTIISKENVDFLQLIREIQSIIGKDRSIHVQTLGMEAKDIVKEGLYLREILGENLYVKVPVIPEGVKAIKILHEENINITATAVITPQQALMASRAGATFIAPYVNRIDNISGNGINVVCEISKLIKIHGLSSKILAASFKNVEQVHKASLAGAEAATLPLNILESLLYHPLTDSSVAKFVQDWENVYGEGKLCIH